MNGTLPRITIDRSLPGDEVTFAYLGEIGTAEIRVTVEFDVGDHDRAALAFDKLATEILEQLAALACPCKPGAPAHAHGQGGYAPGSAPPCDASTTVRSQEGEHDHPRIREHIGRVVTCTGTHHTPDRMHSVLLDATAGPWYAWPMTEPPAPTPDNCVHEWRPFITVDGERMKCLKCGTRPAGSRA